MKIFDKLLGFLPSWVPFAVAGVLLAGLVGGFFALRSAYRAEGAARVELANAKVIAERAEKDRKLSAELVTQLQEKIAAREGTAQPVREVIKYVTPTTCPADPALDAAAGWVRDALGGGRSPAGRQPAPAPRAAGAPAR